MPNVNRVHRTLIRGGELQECLTPTCSQGFEVPAVEVVGPVDGNADGFDAGNHGAEGVGAAGKKNPLELNPTSQPLSSADFQQQQQVQGAQDAQGVQGVQGASAARTQQANPSESPYQGAFWKDSQDFSASNAQSSAQSSPELAPYDLAADAAADDRALTVSGSDFRGAQDVPENARVEQAAQAHEAEMEARRFAEVAQQPFSLLGRQELRA
jgi:hypothetical protein